jgi:hypothetical protein
VVDERLSRRIKSISRDAVSASRHSRTSSAKGAGGTLTKKQEYAAAGVPEYYTLHRERAQMALFSRADNGLYRPIAPVDDVIASRRPRLSRRDLLLQGLGP